MAYLPAIDGIRALGVILVMLFHAKAPYFSGGFLGVDIFFVLSGFLITRILYYEHETNGRINLKNFYIRRFFRLTPALITMLFVYILVAGIAFPKKTLEEHLLQSAISAFYLSDYAKAFLDIPDEISHTWSLAVEERFYIVWPLALLFIIYSSRRSTRRTFLLLLNIYFLSTAWRWYWIESEQLWNEIYYRFDTRVSGLILGSCVAIFLKNYESNISTSKCSIILIAPAFTLPFLLQLSWGEKWALGWGVMLVELASASLLVSVFYCHSVATALSASAFRWIGQLSYGLYLWHYPIFRFMRENWSWQETLLIGGGLSLLLSVISFHSVERLGRHYREKISPRHLRSSKKNSAEVT